MNGVIRYDQWHRFEPRVEQNTRRTLDLLDRHDAKATFFLSGWLAELGLDVVREVVDAGHEVASKGFFHRAHHEMTADEFAEDLTRSRTALEAATGRTVLGYRIPYGRIPVEDPSYFETVRAKGYRYDASVRPFGPRYRPDSRWRRIGPVQGDDDETPLIEVPFSSATFAGVSLPASGGNYLRQMPRWIFDRNVRQCVARQDNPWQFYFHVWELDPDLPRITAVPMLRRVHQYRNLEEMPERIRGYLARYRFTSIAEHLGLEAEPVASRPSRHEQNQPIAIDTGRRRVAVTVVIPCFNEEHSLPYLKRTLEGFVARHEAELNLSFVFVDDGSSDRTWELLDELFGGWCKCKTLRHQHNRGIAAALMTGTRVASDEIVASIDADCSYDPEVLAAMIHRLSDDVDMMVASPYHADGRVLNVPGWRLFLSHNLSRMYRLVLRHKFSTYTSCARVCRRSKVVGLDLKHDGYLGIVELVARLDRADATLAEYPAVLESRLLGQSKLKTVRTIAGHLRLLAQLATGQLTGPDQPLHRKLPETLEKDNV